MSARARTLLLLAPLACGVPPRAETPTGALPTGGGAIPIDIEPAPLPSDLPLRPPSTEKPRLDEFLARLLVRLAADTGGVGVRRHVAAVLLREPSPDAARAACVLLGRPLPPIAHRIDLDEAGAALLSAALLRPPTSSTPEVALFFAHLLAVEPGDRDDLVQVLRRTNDPTDDLLLALGRCGTARDVVDLGPYTTTGPRSMRYAASAAAAALGDARSVEFLQQVLTTGRPENRREVAWSLARVGARGPVAELLALAMADPDPETALPAAVALTEAGDETARERLVAQARSSVPVPRREFVVRALALRPRPEEAETFGSILLGTRDVAVTVEAALALARLGDPTARLLVRTGIRDAPLPETCLGARWLAGLEGVEKASAELLARLSRVAGEDQRVAAGFAIGEVGGSEAAAAIARSLKTDDPAVAAAILGAASVFAEESAPPR